MRSDKPLSEAKDLTSLTHAQLIARIKELQVQLVQTNGYKSVATPNPDQLTTVKVPVDFQKPFLQAQNYVARYFDQRIEQPETATISIAGERYVLVRAASLSVEFIELVMSLYQDKGPEKARSVANNLLFDLAHSIGKADARNFQAKMGVNEPIENLSAGPIHFAFAGWAFVDISSQSHPTPDENYFLLYDHPYSFESHSWLKKGQKSDTPVCIMNAGYSSGWCEESFGLPLVSVEIECQASGGKHCRFIMAPPSRIKEHLQNYKHQHSTEFDLHQRNSDVPEFFQRKHYEDALQAANAALEKRVMERTRELKRQALHDALTGLPNRVLLQDRIDQNILKQQHDGTPFALLFLDLDGFKDINDTFGHHIGDLLLEKVSARLLAKLRDSDTMARLGGDEFAVLLEGAGTAKSAGRLANKLLKSLSAPFVINGHKLAVGGSIGITQCPEHGTDPGDLMRRADVAMYAAKSAQTGIMLYTPEQDIHSPARLKLLAELRSSVSEQDLILHYQPLVNVVSGKTERVEALLRWNHPDGKQLLPDTFLHLAEKGDLMRPITRWILKTAIADCSQWQKAGYSQGIAVNLSPRNLQEKKFPEQIKNLLDKYDLPAEKLVLEITENTILNDNDQAVRALRQLRDIGVGLAIDDFGTGYSSLLHLKRLPFTEIKIDRSFISEVLTSNYDAAIVHSVISLGRELGRTVVAEGVEEKAVLDKLESYGCDFAQGFYFSLALEKEKLLHWIESQKH